MNDSTLIFIEACKECGRVQRVYSESKRRTRRKTAALCADCSAARRRKPSPQTASREGRRSG